MILMSLYFFMLLLSGMKSRMSSDLSLPLHPFAISLIEKFSHCRKDLYYCQLHENEIIELSAKVTNLYGSLLMHDRAQSIFYDAFFIISPTSSLGARLSHILAVLSFSQGEITEVS